jgi:hypothetical protein
MEHYSIYVGAKRPATALVGFLEKNQGQAITKGEVKEIPLEVGAHGFSNYSKVWGRRVIEGQEKSDKLVNVEDPNYKGSIQFLKYGDSKGHFLEIRYLDTCASLDLQYQTLRLRIAIKPDEDKWYIKLPAGENRFDPKKDGTFIQFLQVHHMNKQSKSKSPNAIGTMYEEINEDTIDETNIKVRESKGDAIFLVKNAANKAGQIKNLLIAVGTIPMEGKRIDIRASEREIYDGLMEMADTDPQFLLDRVDNFKRQVSDCFEKAKAYKVIDLTKHGQIAIEDGGKKEILLDKVDGNGNEEKILLYLYENFLNEDIFKALARLKDVCDKIK